jgi:hypothetical protein
MYRPLVYLAGPMTLGNYTANVHEGIKVYLHLLSGGLCLPFLPHLSMLAEVVAPIPYEVAMDYDLGIIERCDMVLRLSGPSPGADREVEHAQLLGKPVYYSLADLIKILEERRDRISEHHS